MQFEYIEFLKFFGTSVALLIAFMLIYSFATPHNEFKLIKEGNSAAAISFGGAILGFVIVLASVIYFTHDIKELLIWSAITLPIQLIVFAILRLTIVKNIECGNKAQALFLAVVSVGTGILNAASISY